MIKAMVFDLDGTLVQTERLKALSYARAAVELCPHTLAEAEAMAAFKDVVGLSRQEVAEALIRRFDLEETARSRMAEFGVGTPWQAFVQVRMRYYDAMLADPQVLRDSQWPHNVALLQTARQMGCKVGLATMSRCQQARRVLDILDLGDAFDFHYSRRRGTRQTRPRDLSLDRPGVGRCSARMPGDRRFTQRGEGRPVCRDARRRREHALHPRGASSSGSAPGGAYRR